MAKIFLTTSLSPDEPQLPLDRMVDSARRSRRNGHVLTDGPDEADLILFVESWVTDQILTQVRRNPIYRIHRMKSIVVCENDTMVPVVPGIYTSIPVRHVRPEWVKTGPYVWMMRESEVDYCAVQETSEFLYSFVGSAYTHSIRDEIMKISDDRAHIEDTGSTTEYIRYSATDPERLEWRRHFDEILARSAFILCPRGMSHSVIRIYESLRAGRVPVIISDTCALPEGPSWNDFSIRIPESQIPMIPTILREYEPRHREMGLQARRAWEAWFSKDILFDRHVEWALALQALRVDGTMRRRIRWCVAITRTYWRVYARLLKNRIVKRILG